jgi:hypothetical protein
MTRNDLLCGNVDLLTFCGRLIGSQPATSLVVQWTTPVLTIDATRLDRIDIYVDGRPQQSHDIVDHLQVTVVDPREEIRIEGFSGENLQQIRTVRLT